MHYQEKIVIILQKERKKKSSLSNVQESFMVLDYLATNSDILAFHLPYLLFGLDPSQRHVKIKNVQFFAFLQPITLF